MIREIEETSYCAVGRKYGVSDNAVRKWFRFYERERARLECEGYSDAVEPGGGDGSLLPAANPSRQLG